MAEAKVIRRPDGSIQIGYYDPSGNPITGYSVGPYAETNYLGDPVPPEVVDEMEDGGEEQEFLKPRVYNADDGNEQMGESFADPKSFERNPSNNFGYTPSSTVSKVMSAVPGPAGLAGRVATAVENLNQNKAVEKAKKGIGLDPKDYGEPVGGLSSLKDSKYGKVADVTNPKTGKSYTVGLEALDKRGITTMTPTEANKRAAMFGTRLATPDEVKEQGERGKVAGAKAKSKGLLGKALDIGNVAIDKVVDTVKDAVTNTKSKPKETKVGEPVERETAEYTGKPLGVETPNVTIDTPSAPQAKSVTPGLGLANLTSPASRAKVEEKSAPDVTGIDYSHPERGTWDQGLTPEAVEATKALNGLMGGLSISSAARSKGLNSRVSKAKNSSHVTGNAIDIDLSGKTPQQKQQAVEAARMSGFKGMGTYSTDDSLHLDLNPRENIERTGPNVGALAGTYGMRDYSQRNLANAPGWFEAGMTQTTRAAVPVDKPDVPSQGTYGPFAGPIDRGPVSPYDYGTPEEQGPMVAGYGITPTNPSSVPAGPISPAGFTSLGLGRQYTPEEKEARAGVIAGELGARTLSRLSVDPEAQKEAAAISGVIDNRVNSTAYADKPNPLASALTAPAQFSALGRKQMPTTEVNYDKYGQVIKEVLDQNPANPVTNATHYQNPEESKDRSWGQTGTPVGDEGHRFSTPDATFSPDQKSYGLGYGPIAAKAISSPMGTPASPASTYGSMTNPTGFGSIDTMGMVDPSSPAGMGSALGGLAGWGPGASVQGGVNETIDKSADLSADTSAGVNDSSTSADTEGTGSDTGADGSDGNGGGSSGAGTGTKGLGSPTGPSTGTKDKDKADGSKGNESY